MRFRNDISRPTARRGVLFAAVLGALIATAVVVPTAQAIVGGTDQTSDDFAAPLAYIEITEPSSTGTCSGTLISPTVVLSSSPSDRICHAATHESGAPL